MSRCRRRLRRRRRASDSPRRRRRSIARADGAGEGEPRRFSSLTRRDQLVLWIIVGVPTAIHVVFVWIPAISTIVLSFTNWNGIVAVGDIRFVGFRNYWEIFTVFEKDFWSAAINNGFLVVFLFLVPTALGVLLAYLLDKNLRGGADLPEHLLHARRAVARRRRLHLEERDVLAAPGPVLDDPRSHRPGQPDRLARRPVPPDLVRRSYGISKNFVAILIAIAWRHTGYIMVLYLAGLKSRRPGAARSGRDRRLHRVAGVPPRRVPGDEADQRRRRASSP